MARAYSDDSADEEYGESMNNVEMTLTSCFEEKVRPFIDVVDKLRRHGLEQDIDLPSIVVIGDQSSGKSSILEAISGIQLPRGSGIVTRCPLEMQLKKKAGAPWSALLRYMTLNRELVEKKITHPGDVGYLIREAQNEIAGTGKEISDSLITLSVTSANSPDLTLIDLPGIARTAVDGQPQNICEQIKNLIHKYIEKENAIMLCVIPANVDLAVNEALSFAVSVDSNGNRTLGVITKPDLVDCGAEADVIAILNNNKFSLKKGFSIVRCRGLKNIANEMSLEDALEQEEAFFREHPEFCHVNEDQRGTSRLARKLTENLVEHIENSLPGLREEINQKLDAAHKDLSFMSRAPPAEKSGKILFLLDLTEKLMRAVEKAVIQGDMLPSEVVSKDRRELRKLHAGMTDTVNTSYVWRLRFIEFQERMKKSSDAAFKKENLSVSQIERQLSFHRGRELPHFINFDLFESMARNHIKRYHSLATDCLEQINKDLESIIEHLNKEHLQRVPNVLGIVRKISDECRKECFERGISMINHEMKKENLVFTQDHTYVSEIDALQEKLRQMDQNQRQPRRGPSNLVFSLTGDDELNSLENNAAVMQKLLKVYIRIANRRIQDNIPMMIRTMQHHEFRDMMNERLKKLVTDDNVENIVLEDPKSAMERSRLEEKIKRLSNALDILNNII